MTADGEEHRDPNGTNSANQPGQAPESGATPETNPSATTVPPVGVPLPPELSPPTDAAPGGVHDPEIQSQLDEMREAIEKEKQGIEELDAKIRDAKQHEKKLRRD